MPLKAALEKFCQTYPEHTHYHDVGRDAIVDAHLDRPGATASFLAGAGFFAVRRAKGRNRELNVFVPDTRIVPPDSPEFEEFLAGLPDAERDEVDEVLHVRGIQANPDGKRRVGRPSYALQRQALRTFRESKVCQKVRSFVL